MMWPWILALVGVMVFGIVLVASFAWKIPPVDVDEDLTKWYCRLCESRPPAGGCCRSIDPGPLTRTHPTLEADHESGTTPERMGPGGGTDQEGR